MGSTTAIEWADSTLNMMMGCDGCELSSRAGSGTCYAETLTDRYAGSSAGYPSSFYQPKLFTARLEQALRWKDLTGTDRPDKPWLSGRPRHIFNGDMGDYWTESLPLDWLAPYVRQMADSPHVWIFLTKRPARMRKFWKAYGRVPWNFILMTSYTGPETLGRVAELIRIPDCNRGLSCEPLLGEAWFQGERGLDSRFYLRGNQGDRRISWVICGGESGPGARPMDISWMRSLKEQCEAAGAPYFGKQLGSRPLARTRWDMSEEVFREYDAAGWVEEEGGTILRLKDRKGGDPSEWPEDLRVREMPEVARG